MMVPAAKVAASGLLLIITSQCTRNMIQTARIAAAASSTSSNSSWNVSLAPSSITLESDNISDRKTVAEFIDPPRAVRYLQSLKRSDLLELFISSVPPDDLTALNGEWNGLLLDNNGKIMTTVSNVMTHTFFGRGTRWNGKQFSISPARNCGTGVNRFVSSAKDPPTTPTTPSAGSRTIIKTRHEFDYEIQDSKLQLGSQAVRLRYDRHHVRLSPWRTMSDELRMVRGAEGDVLIGMGCMAWSGGMLNAAPFCLWRATPQS